MECKVINKRKEKFDVNIGRPSKWGNPFVIGKDGNREQVIQKYADWIIEQPELMKCLSELQGKILGCYCKPQDCHGDILKILIDDLPITSTTKGIPT